MEKGQPTGTELGSLLIDAEAEMVAGADVLGGAAGVGVSELVEPTGGVELPVDGVVTVDTGLVAVDEVPVGGLLVVSGGAGRVLAEVGPVGPAPGEVGGVLPAEGPLTDPESGPEAELELPTSPGPLGMLTAEFADVPAPDGCAATTACDGDRFGSLEEPAAVLVVAEPAAAELLPPEV